MTSMQALLETLVAERSQLTNTQPQDVDTKGHTQGPISLAPGQEVQMSFIPGLIRLVIGILDVE